MAIKYRTEEGKIRATYMISPELHIRFKKANIQYGLKSQLHETIWDSLLNLLEEDPSVAYAAMLTKKLKVVIEE